MRGVVGPGCVAIAGDRSTRGGRARFLAGSLHGYLYLFASFIACRDANRLTDETSSPAAAKISSPAVWDGSSPAVEHCDAPHPGELSDSRDWKFFLSRVRETGC